MAAGRGDKARGHVVAEERNFRDVGAIDDRKEAAVDTAVICVAEKVMCPPTLSSRKFDSLPMKVERLSSHGAPLEPATTVTSPESGTLTPVPVLAVVIVADPLTGGSVIIR